jgi:hypothetical protein
MFIAQVDEVDAYDSKGCRVNDINSLVEYVNDILLDHKGPSRPDEDDDNARYFHIIKAFDFSISQQVVVKNPGWLNATEQQHFPGINSGKPVPAFYDVVTPPPKFIA